MTREKIVPRQFYSNYVKKAQEFYEISHIAFEKRNWNSCVSCAVHAAISIVDAIAVQQLGKRSSTGNHIETVLLLSDVKTSDENRKSNLRNALHELINMKTPSEYEERLMSKADATKALDRCKKVYDFLLTEIERGKV